MIDEKLLSVDSGLRRVLFFWRLIIWSSISNETKVKIPYFKFYKTLLKIKEIFI